MNKKILFAILFVISPAFLYTLMATPGGDLVEPYEQSPKKQLKTDPLIAVVLMVKNEEAVIVPTLEPLVKAGMDTYYIFDTGSTDKTMENAKEFFEKNNITNYVISQEPFVDFATSRNRALDLTREAFPDSVFMLMPDAEWYLNNGSDLINFCKQNVHDFHSMYLICVNNGNDDFYHGRLLRTKANLRFAGVVHEVIATAFLSKIPENIKFDYRPRRTGIEASAERWKRDVQLLLKEFERNPKDSRSAFYLAQSYECLGDLYNAYKYYQIRSKLHGWDEEDYETFYRLGRVVNSISEYDKKFTKKMAYDYYMTAYNMRPHRAEPLVSIAEMNWPSNYCLCFRFAKLSLEKSYPKDEMLFVNKEMYEFTRYEILSKVCWYVNEFELGEHATRKAIEARPHLIHLYNNLKLYMDRKNQILVDELSRLEIARVS